MLELASYFGRLLPANPILIRVVSAAGKRRRDFATRCIYLGLFVLVVLFSLLSQQSLQTTSLTDLSVASRAIFRSMSYLQLGLVALLAPVFTAGAITQEKDSQTYDILLATPLSNGQIVLGSLMSRLFFVLALLVSGIPIFSVTQIFGGVSINSIVMSFAIAAATALVTGALAMAIATFKVGTRRTIFSFYLFIVIYMIGLWLLDQLPGLQIAGPRSAAGHDAHISWFTGIQPFLALRVVLGDPQYRPPDFGMLPPFARGWPLNWYLTNPASFYVVAMSVLSVVLIIPAIIFLRRLAQSTTTFQSWMLQLLHVSKGDRTRKPRTVWSNPIAWREARTKASAARASVMRYGFMTLGLCGAIVLVYLSASTATMPPKYIGPGSYDPGRRTLFFNGDTTYILRPDVQLTLDGVDAKESILNGNYAVSGFQTQAGPMRTTQISAIQFSPIPTRLEPKRARTFLLGAVVLELAIILLIITNAAASTVTREKEDGSLDLLLTTPITSRYYIWGKLRGLISYVVPLLAVPVMSVAIFVVYDLFDAWIHPDPNRAWLVLPEAVLLMPPVLLIIAAFASMLGMQMSLRFRTTIGAVMSSVAIVAGICALLVGCGQALISSSARGDDTFHLLVSGFSPFTMIALLVDPYTMHDAALTHGDTSSARFFLAIGAVVATGAYTAVVWSLYKSMVKNFDMTIRRQSR